MADNTTELEVLDQIVDVLGGQSGQYETVVPVLQQIKELLASGITDPESIAEAVTAWLTDHPEATTTVQDGSITGVKIADDTIPDAKLVQTGGVLSEVAGIKGAVFSESEVTLDSEAVYGYWSNGRFTTTAHKSSIKASVDGLTAIHVNNEIPKFYDVYDFLDESENVLGFLRNMNDAAVFDLDLPVPDGAKWVAVSTNSSAKVPSLYVSTMVTTSKVEELSDKVDVLDARVDLLTGETSVTLTKAGDNIQVRSNIAAGTDIAIRGNLFGSPNKAFTFTRSYTMPSTTDYEDMQGGTQFKTMNDDICPVFFNYSYRGGGHGDDRGKKVTVAAGHGLTEANIGEVWTDANNRGWMILNILSTTEIGMAVPAANSFEKKGFEAYNPVSPITHGNQSVAFDSYAAWLVSPSVNHVSVKAYVDGGEITENGVYSGGSVDLVESYDIIYIPAMTAYLAEHVGSNTNQSMYDESITEKYCTINNVYHFTERGAITCYQTVDFDRDVYLNSVGLVQSEPIGNYIAVPDTTSYAAVYDMGNTPSTAIDLDSTKWADTSVPPNRIFQFANAGQTRGIVVGYCTEYGDAVPSVRASAVARNAGTVYTYHKLYPFIVNTGGTQTGGKLTISGITYKVPIYATDEQFPAVGWYYVGNDVYVLVDCQSTVSGYLKLPPKMMGMKAEIVDSYGSISIASPFVSSSGLLVNVNTYGSAVIKLTN